LIIVDDGTDPRGLPRTYGADERTIAAGSPRGLEGRRSGRGKKAELLDRHRDKAEGATSAVIATGRKRVSAPSMMALRLLRPRCIRCLMKLSITRPLRTAIPERAMNPTAAETENGMPRSHSATAPPVSASGAALNTSSASRPEPSAPPSNRNMSAKHPETTTIRRWRAAIRFSNCPPHVSQ
jgi:hypothetical protein